MTPEPVRKAVDKTRAKASMGVRSFRGRIAAGIVLIIPLAVTAILMRYVYGLALSFGATLLNWIALLTAWVSGIEDKSARTIDLSNPTKSQILVAVSLTVLLLYVIGWLGSNVVGRRFIESIESLVVRIPLVDTIYGSMKRMVQALSGVGKEERAQRVVLVNFPHENMKTIAFMTNTLTDTTTGKRYATVYVPTTPNPTGGYMEIVALDQITQTDWTMEEALSIILSGGATVPSSVRMQPGPGLAGFGEDRLAAEVGKEPGKSGGVEDSGARSSPMRR
ncbi:MAG: DUF502 domain-containing protein [Planctomycetes bacterium]|nr:DUF502 domain-containing protein [Planctomycetota bacterium]